MTTAALDFETTKKPNHMPWLPGAHVVTANLMDIHTKERWHFIFKHNEYHGSYLEAVDNFKQRLNNFRRLIAHNGKFECHWLLALGIDPLDFDWWCTLVAEYTLRYQLRIQDLSLDDLAKDRGLPPKLDKVKAMWESGYETTEIPLKLLVPYGNMDTTLAAAIAVQQRDECLKRGIAPLINQEMMLVPRLAHAERNGMKLNLDKLRQYEIQYTRMIEDIEARLQALYGLEEIYYEDKGQRKSIFDSSKKVTTLLYSTGKIKFTPTKKNTGEPFLSQQTDILKQLVTPTKEHKEVIKLLLERSRLAQMRKTFFTGLQKRAVGDYVHHNLNQAIAATSRLTCSDPNLQNQPRGTTGPVKECFETRYYV